MTFKISEKTYLKNPTRYKVHFVGWNDSGSSWAMVSLVPRKENSIDDFT